MLQDKEKFKNTWVYKHLRGFIMWPFDFAH